MRNPSIHIKESDLITVLQGVLCKNPNKNYKELAKEILVKAKSYSVNARGVYSSNDKVEKKVIKMRLSARSDTAIFAQLLLLLRRQAKHRGLTLIQPGEPEWFNLKEASKLATEFCNEFQISLKEGYKEYIKIGLSKMKNFSVNKFKTIHAHICNEYEAIQEIARDPTPQETLKCHSIYMGIIGDKIGFTHGYQNIPIKYRYFVKAKEEAKKLGVTLSFYIKAQFQGLEWASAIPDPSQLVGITALERLQKYAFENNQVLGEKRNIVDFKKIKRERNNRK